jgi:undecaprenyl-diphosphatase
MLDLILFLKACAMGLVEGFTEFLPISSTGHLVLLGSLLGFDDERAKVFDIAIQSGAIFAVVLVFWQKISQTLVALPRSRMAQEFTLHIVIAFLPAAVFGLLLGHWIKDHLFTPQVVASTFVLGGFIILWAEKRSSSKSADHHPNDDVRILNVESMTRKDALKVGLVQCLAMIPGTSRSGATIIGGMFLGLSRKAATEFSFYLAIPTLLAAGGYSLFKARHLLSLADAPLFLTGLIVSFVSAWVCVKWLLRYVGSHSFVPFAYYRIAFGVFIWVSVSSGLINWGGA